METPRLAVKKGSSPRLSAILPQRGSLEISSIGANVQLTPWAAASVDADFAHASTRPGFQLAACPNGIGITTEKP